MSYQELWSRQKGQSQIRATLSFYRFLAFATAAIHLFLLSPVYESLVPTVPLILGLGVYSLVKVLQPLRWQQAGTSGYILLGIDIAVCAFLVFTTGGFFSSFLLYTLAPVLTASLLMDSRVASSIAGISVFYMICSHLANPFYSFQLSLSELSYALVYIIAVVLTTALPYLTNLNMRQRLKSEDVLQERRRLSREIHDGTAQLLSAARWQAQVVRRHLNDMGIYLNEVEELIKITEEAYQNSRESLELLRNYNGNGNFLPHLRDYLRHLKQDTGIDFQMGDGAEEMHLEALAELELLRICQEALTNIRKHAQAQNVQIRVDSVNSHFKITITDDGRGFDAIKYYHNGNGNGSKSHGLAVMEERAESVGGRLKVLSMPGKGTEVQIEVPSKGVDCHG